MTDLESQLSKAKAAQQSEQLSDGLEAFPTYIRWLIKIGTVILGLNVIFFGIFAAISVRPLCVVGGILAV